MGSQIGYGSLMKASILIVLRHLHRFLHLAVLFLLVLCLSRALYTIAIAADSALLDICNILGNVFLTYLFALTSKDWSLALLSSTEANPHGRDFALKLVFVFFGLPVVVQVKEAYVATRMMAICRDFGIGVLLMTLGGVIYAAQELASSSSSSYGDQQDIFEVKKKSRGRWTYTALTWGRVIYMASAGVSGIAFSVLSCWFFLGERVLNGQLHGWWPSFMCISSVLVLGTSVVGLFPLLLASLLSTQAALYFSCNSYLWAVPSHEVGAVQDPSRTSSCLITSQPTAP